MFRLNPISSSMKMLAVSALAFNTIPNTAYANEASAEDESVERIQVTGTRILREGVVAPAPITVIGEDAIKASGATNLGDLLNSLPALGNTFSMSSSTNYIGTTGSNFLDLRRLGSNRTLVLIDGKRHVASDIGTARVDVNTIPTEWIKSVEVITGGASAVYGADAVSGVVNFILKDNIDGVHFSAQKSDAADSGFSDYKYAFSAGGEFANGKGNAAVSLEVAGQNTITQADRGHSSYSDIRNPNEKNEVKGENKIPDKLRVKDAGLHIYSDGGRFALDDGGYMFLPDGTFRKQKLGNLYDDFRCAGDCDWFDFSKGSTYQPEFKRITFNSKVNYDINDQASLYFHGKYSQTKATDHADWTFSRGETIQKDNAFASADLVELMAKNNLESISIRRIHTDMGRRSEENIRQTSRFVSGLKGSFLEDWDYDVSVVWGQTTTNRKNFNNLIKERFKNAVDAVVDPNTGKAVCRATLDANADQSNPNIKGCVPVNLLGNGNVSQAAQDWFMTTSLFQGKTTQTVYSGSVSNGALFELPAGDVGFAVGAEYRKETAEGGYDEQVVSGETFLTAIAPLEGQFDVTEVFTEFSIPLLADLPGVDLMTLDLAARYSDYSTTGSATTWKAGIDWSIYEDLRTRMTYAKAVRAPNIDELFSPLGGNFAFYDDPCDVKNDQDNATYITTIKANCAASSVPANYTDPRSGNKPVQSGGNPELDPETSTSLTFGFVYTPEFLDGFSATVDYWKFEIEDVIATLSVQKTLDYCYRSTSGIGNKYCAAITRDANGQVSNVKSINQNLAKKDAEGIDFDFAYSFEAFSGEFNTRLIATYLMTLEDYPFQEDLSNSDSAVSEIGDPRWQGSFSTNYAYEDFNINWKMRYVGGMYTEERDTLAANPDAISPTQVGSVTYHDVQARYHVTDDFETYIGIDNLLDKDAPNGYTGAGVGSAIYDNIGRKFYAGLAYSF